MSRPAATVLAVAAMAVGLGAAVAIASVVDAVLLRPLPYPEPERLVLLWNQYTRLGLPEVALSEPEVVDYRTRCAALEAVAAVAVRAASVTGSGEPERIRIAAVSPSLFTILGARPRLGRVFAGGEDRPGARPVALLSDSFWRRRQRADPRVVGRDLLMNGERYQIVGVMPSGFHYPEKVDLWVPLLPSADPQMQDRGNHYLKALGRLKPGVGLRQARAEILAAALQMQRETPNKYPPNSGWGATLVPFQEDLTGGVRPALREILAVVGLALLLASANAVVLLRGRSIAQSLGVACLGGGLGTLIAALVLRPLSGMDPATLPRARDVSVDGRILLFAVALTLVSGRAIGRAAAVPSGRRGGGWGRRVLAAVELALALVLVAAAGRQARTYLALRHVDLGFATDHALTLEVSLPAKTYATAPQVSAFYQRLVEGVAALPGVRHAGMVDCLPLAPCGLTTSIFPKDRPSDGGPAAREADLRIVTWDFFAALGMRPPLQGRLLGPQDGAGATRAVVFDEGLAGRTWPGESPLGKQLKFTRNTTNPQRTVVGVVRHIRDSSLDPDPRDQVYVPFAQFPFSFNEAFLVARCERDPAALSGPVRAVVRKLDPEVPLFDIQTLDQRRADDLAPQRLALSLLTSLAVLVLCQAAVGVYGSTAPTSHQRTAIDAAAGEVT